MAVGDDIRRAEETAGRLTAAGFPAMWATAGHPPRGHGGDPPEWDNNTLVVTMGANVAARLAVELASLRGLLLSGKGRGKSPWPDMSSVTDEVLRDILLLCGRDVPLAVIAQWSERERFTACEWAALKHLSASDNPVRTVDEPWFVKIAAQAAWSSKWDEYLARLEGSQSYIDQDHSISLSEARREIASLRAQVAGMQAAAEDAPVTAPARDGGRREAEVARFTAECLEVTEPEDGVPGPGLLAVYRAYGDWARRGGCMAMPLTPFHATLREAHPSVRDDGVHFPGLRIRT